MKYDEFIEIEFKTEKIFQDKKQVVLLKLTNEWIEEIKKITTIREDKITNLLHEVK